MKKLHYLLYAFILMSVPAMAQTETLKINWPANWKIDSDQENDKMRMVELIPKKDKIDSWTILGTEMTIKNIDAGAEAVMKMTFDQTKAKAPKATLTEIARDDKAAHPWIIFKIESPEYPGSPYTESQLYYAVQGKQNLYSNFVALKQATLAPDFVDKWTATFKQSEIVARK